MYYIQGIGYVSNSSGFADASGARHQAGWFAGKSPEEIAAIGAVPVEYGPRPDDRYFWVTEHQDGASITYTGVPKENLIDIRLAELAAYRYSKETAGIIVAGNIVNTERDSQALITGAALAATLDANYTVKWKAQGGWMQMDAATIIAVASSVRAHVQACFDNEAAHDTVMRAITDPAELIAYDFTTNWPATAADAEA